MRELKFKALLSYRQMEKQEIITKYYWEYSDGNSIYTLDNILNERSICQYIDLQDKDGNDIYSDDILEMSVSHALFGDSKRTFVVTWMIDKGYAEYRFVEKIGPDDVEFSWPCGKEWSKQMRVVGNVHDAKD